MPFIPPMLCSCLENRRWKRGPTAVPSSRCLAHFVGRALPAWRLHALRETRHQPSPPTSPRHSRPGAPVLCTHCRAENDRPRFVSARSSSGTASTRWVETAKAWRAPRFREKIFTHWLSKNKASHHALTLSGSTRLNHARCIAAKAAENRHPTRHTVSAQPIAVSDLSTLEQDRNGQPRAW